MHESACARFSQRTVLGCLLASVRAPVGAAAGRALRAIVVPVLTQPFLLCWNHLNFGYTYISE